MKWRKNTSIRIWTNSFLWTTELTVMRWNHAYSWRSACGWVNNGQHGFPAMHRIEIEIVVVYHWRWADITDHCSSICWIERMSVVRWQHLAIVDGTNSPPWRRCIHLTRPSVRLEWLWRQLVHGSQMIAFHLTRWILKPIVIVHSGYGHLIRIGCWQRWKRISHLPKWGSRPIHFICKWNWTTFNCHIEVCYVQLNESIVLTVLFILVLVLIPVGIHRGQLSLTDIVRKLRCWQLKIAVRSMNQTMEFWQMINDRWVSLLLSSRVARLRISTQLNLTKQLIELVWRNASNYRRMSAATDK